MYKFRIDVKEDINKCREVLPVMLYLAGYCCNVVFKKIKNNCCKYLNPRIDNVENTWKKIYFLGFNRGSNLYPNDWSTNFVIYNVVVIDILIKHDSFLHSVNQRKLAMHITLNVFEDYELLFKLDTCD